MPVAALAPRAHYASLKRDESDLSGRDEGDGGEDGTVIALTLVQESPYQGSYVAPIAFGDGSSTFHLQVDTGSSDWCSIIFQWIAATTCDSSLCKGAPRYDPSSSSPTGRSQDLKFASGEASGPIVWDSVQLGGYQISNQAFVAADTVNNEPLSSQYSGVLGLALPDISYISSVLPTGADVADGATVPSNLFSLTPSSNAPPARFFSVALERPGSRTVPSVLGIGRHPSSLVHDPSKIQYDTIVPLSKPSWWKAHISGITVHVDGQDKPVSLSGNTPGSDAGKPTAILDTGVPIILATQAIANGIYGALGIGPGSDGNFYMSCTTPLNISIQLDNRTSIYLHPLDMSYQTSDSTQCLGFIQTPQQFPGLSASINNAADIILGVPFLRNVYTVLAYDEPLPDGTFPRNSQDLNQAGGTRPHLGLLGLTDPAVAAVEFHQARVLGRPLGSSPSNSTPSPMKGLSIGVKVVIGFAGFFGLCILLFGGRWLWMRRKYGDEPAAAGATDGKDGYVLAARKPSLGEDDGTLTEDELRQRRFEDYRRKNSASYYSADTALTMVESNSSDRRKTYIRGNPDEFGALVPLASSRTLSGTGTRASYLDGWDDSTYVDDAARRDNMFLLSPPPPAAFRSPSRASVHSHSHSRTLSNGPDSPTPLLSSSHPHRASQTPMLPASGMDLADIADLIDSASPTRASFAGVGSGSASLRSPRPRSGAGPGAGVRASLALSPSPIGEEPPPTLRSPLRQAHAVPDDTPRALVDVLPSPPPPTLVAQEAP